MRQGCLQDASHKVTANSLHALTRARELREYSRAVRDLLLTTVVSIPAGEESMDSQNGSLAAAT